MTELGTALHARGKLLTAAVISNGNTQGVQPAVFGQVDFLNIMLYDGGTPARQLRLGDHLRQPVEGAWPADQ